MTIRWFDQGPLEVSRSGQLFFQPLDLHLEPADLLGSSAWIAWLASWPWRRPSRNSDSMPSRSGCFPLLIGTEWTWNVPDSSARVRVRWAASRATRALKAAECRFFVPVMTLFGMEQ